jgi:hypothetical protein
MKGQVGLLLGLRLRTMLRGRSTGQNLMVAVSALLVLLPMSLGLAWAVGDTTRWLASGEHAPLLGEWTHLVLLVAWLLVTLLPALGLGGNEFYDVTRLFHLPVSHRTVLVAQNLGLMFGGSVLFFLPALVALAVTLPGGGGAVLLRLLLLPLYLFLGVTLSQALQLLLLRRLRRRRFRDLAGILMALIAASVVVGSRLLLHGDEPRERIAEVLSFGLSRWLAPVPSFWISGLWAPEAGLTQAVVFLAAFLPLTLLLVVVAAALHEQAFHGEVAAPALAAVPDGERDRARRPSRLRFLPGPVRAIAATERKVFRREPTVKSLLLQHSVFFLVPVVVAVWQTGANAGEWAGVWGLYALLFVESLLAVNLFGLDGGGVAHLLALPVSSFRLLTGKVLWAAALWCVVNALAMVALAAALLLVVPDFPPGRLITMPVAAVAGTLVLLAIGSVISALIPIPLAARSRRALGQQAAGRTGCAEGVGRLVAYVVLLVLLVPVLLFCRRPWLCPLALLYAGILLLAGLRLGASTLDRERERLYLAFTRSSE